MEKHTYGYFLKKIIQEKGLTYRDIAERTGIPQNSISHYANDIRQPDYEKMRIIAEKIDVPISYFFGDYASMDTLDTSLSDDDYVYVPVYEVSASAGYGTVAFNDEYIKEMRLLSRSFLPRKNGEYHILYVEGDSMTPTLNPHEPVLVDVSIKEIVCSGIYILRINNGLFIKRVDLHPDGTVMVTSDNKKYSDFMIRMGDDIQLNVLGKAVLNFQLL